MTPPLLEARELCVEIGGKTVVDRVNLQVRPGECLAILGRNGAGKSTLLSTLAGLRPPASGRVCFDGIDGATLTPRDLACKRAWLGQFQSDPFASSVMEAVLTGRHPHLGRWAWESAHDRRMAEGALQAVGLEHMENRLVHTLSGGERQRLAIATLFAQATPLYLLDEPLAHLDLNHQMAVLERFAATARDCHAGVVMVLHDPALAHRFCHRALLLHGDGRHALGEVDAVLTGENLSGLFGHPLRQIDVDGHRCFVPA